MMRRLVAMAIWLAAGGAAVGLLYWGFLNTPESNALTLTLSALLAIAMLLVAGIVINAAVLLALDASFAASLRIGARRLHWFLIVASAAVVATWAIRQGDHWIARHSGEIGAWFIATFDWSDVTPLLRVEGYLSTWLRWVVVPVAALAALTCMLQRDAREVMRGSWVRAAWHWRTLLIATASFVLLFALPWRVARWRPVGLPPTWVEPALAGTKLLLVGAAVAIGAAIIIRTVARSAATVDARQE